MAKAHYQRVGDAPDENEDVYSDGEFYVLPSDVRRRCHLTLSILLGFVILAITLVAIAVKIKRQVVVDQCGITPEEASARGCFFEMTLSLWVPEECYDRELEAEYFESPGLHYYRDINFIEEVPFDEVKLGQKYAWFVPWEHHIRHCSFSLKKLHRAVNRGGKIDGYILNYNHTLHCIDMMTNPPEKVSKLPQRDVRMYPYCGRKWCFNVDKFNRGQWTD